MQHSVWDTLIHKYIYVYEKHLVLSHTFYWLQTLSTVCLNVVASLGLIFILLDVRYIEIEDQELPSQL